MQTSMSVPAIMEDASTTVTTQLGPITALAIIVMVGQNQTMVEHAQVHVNWQCSREEENGYYTLIYSMCGN